MTNRHRWRRHDTRTIELDGTTVRIRAHDPGAAAVQVLHHLGPDVGSIQSFEIVQPSLETAFRELTGPDAAATNDEIAHVA